MVVLNHIEESLEEFREKNLALLPESMRAMCLHIFKKEEEKAEYYRLNRNEPFYKFESLHYGEWLMFGCHNANVDYIIKALYEIIDSVYWHCENKNNFIQNCSAWLKELCRFYMLDEYIIYAIIGMDIENIAKKYLVHEEEKIEKALCKNAVPF